MAFFLARVSGSSFEQPGRARACRPAAARARSAVRCRDAHDGPVGLGERERSSATSNFVLIMVPARADGDAGLTIHGASLRK